MEGDKEKLDELQKFFHNIVRLHGKPCVILLEVREDDIIKLLAVGSSTVEMKLVIDEQKVQDYLG